MALTSVRRPMECAELVRTFTKSAQWKTFDFFEVSQVTAPDDETKSFFDNNEISCICSGSENLFVGSFDGTVRILSSKFKVLRTFQAHDSGSITHMKQVEGTSLLVTIAVRIGLERIDG